jgi:hypothetical protein
MSYYYNVFDDLTKYPDCWCYVIVGGRNTGKTYGALKGSYERHKPFIFIKRTNKDIDLLCAGSGTIGTKKNQYGLDLSPFKSINRDTGSNVKAFKIHEGLGGFWECTAGEQGEETPSGAPVGTLISLNSVSKFKGFDMAENDYLIFDEFIPAPWEKVNRKEGEQLMDLYKTVSRDREHRGREPLKLICLANAVNISNPTNNILEITDVIADMQLYNIETNYIKDRGIFIRILKPNEEFEAQEEQSTIYKAMGGTAWGQMALKNKFAFNDFTNVGRPQIKGYRPLCSYIYKYKHYYIYQKDEKYYITYSAFNAKKPEYNLDTENDQKRFYYDFAFDLRQECINGNMLFESYTMYETIINYHKIFQLR